MLNDEQKATVREWAAAGADLADIHERMHDDLGVSMTYLDARLLVSELEVSLDKPLPETEDDESEPQAQDASGGQLVDERGGQLSEGSVNVSVDAITQPQAMVSGKVTFSDGNSAAWSIDPMGRLALDPDQPGYQPVEEDLAEFQSQLKAALKTRGF